MATRRQPDVPYSILTTSPSEALGGLNPMEAVNAPPHLYYSGDITLLRRHPRVSIVGAREASPDGLRRAAKLAKILVEYGGVVVSGLAAGIDRAAHMAAIEHRGRTIAVIGTAIDAVYPRAHAELQATIAREHLLISQFPAGYPTQKGNFIRRNRTMALIVDASVIIEAGNTSGSLSQGWEALRLARPLFIAKSVLDRPDLTWPQEMLRYGARVLTNPDGLLEALPFADLQTALSAAS